MNQALFPTEAKINKKRKFKVLIIKTPLKKTDKIKEINNKFKLRKIGKLKTIKTAGILCNLIVNHKIKFGRRTIIFINQNINGNIESFIIKARVKKKEEL